MGIVASIRNAIVKGAANAADNVSTLSQLSPSQIEYINNDRKQYLTEKPKLNSPEAAEKIRRNLGAIGIEVYNTYLPYISSSIFRLQRKNILGPIIELLISRLRSG